MLEGKLKIEASLTNFDAIVVPDKNAFFAGENFTGRIILGKNDPTLKQIVLQLMVIFLMN